MFVSQSVDKYLDQIEHQKKRAKYSPSCDVDRYAAMFWQMTVILNSPCAPNPADLSQSAHALSEGYLYDFVDKM